MKKIITSAIMLSLAIAILLSSVQVNAENNLLIGDANGDGEVTAEDAATILRYVVELIELDENCLINADANLDGRVTPADAALVLRCIVGLDVFQKPTPNPTDEPTLGSTENPTAEPTNTPIITTEPTPTPIASETPTSVPIITPDPTEIPTLAPTQKPTEKPTVEPTAEPTEEPTPEPTPSPSPAPTATPTPEPYCEYIWVVDEPAHWELKCNACGFQTDNFDLMKEEQLEHTRHNEPCGYHLVWVIERGHWEVITP